MEQPPLMSTPCLGVNHSVFMQRLIMRVMSVFHITKCMICPFCKDYNLTVITNQPRTRPEVGYFLFGTCCGQVCVFTLKSALV